MQSLSNCSYDSKDYTFMSRGTQFSISDAYYFVDFRDWNIISIIYHFLWPGFMDANHLVANDSLNFMGAQIAWN